MVTSGRCKTLSNGLKKLVQMRHDRSCSYGGILTSSIKSITILKQGEILPDLTFEDKMKIAYEHLKRLIDLKGEHIAVREFRGLAPHYPPWNIWRSQTPRSHLAS